MPGATRLVGGSRRLAAAAVMMASLIAGVATAAAPTTPAMAAGAAFVGNVGPVSCGVGVTYCWSPSSATVNAGDTVSWGNGSGMHGLEELTGPWPATCPNTSLGSCSFSQAGTYTFQCYIHKDQMKGQVTVTSVAPPTQASHPATPSAKPKPTSSASPSPSPSPSPSDSPLPSPSDSPTPSPSDLFTPTTVPSSPADSGGPPVTQVGIAIGVLLVAAGAGIWFWRGRRGPLKT